MTVSFAKGDQEIRIGARNKTTNAKIVVKSTRMGYNSSSKPEMFDNFCNFEPTKL